MREPGGALFLDDAELPYGLMRFAGLVGEDVPLDADGFLDVASCYFTDEAPQRVDALADSESSFVLLGAGGAGKSSTLEALAAVEGVPCLDLRSYSPGELRRILLDAANHGGPVYLDTVDLLGGSSDGASALPVHELEQAVRSGVRLRLGCRTAAWKPSLAKRLGSAAQGFETFVLAPVDKFLAAKIAGRVGVDGAAFVEALVAARRGRISASPQRLEAAAVYWRAHGELPSRHFKAIDYEVSSLLIEHDDGRPLPLAADRARLIAERIAAVSVFADSAVLSPSPCMDSALSIVDLPTNAEPDHVGDPVTAEDYRSVLATGLFEAIGVGRLVFRHQQYAEYLAAAYLVRRGLGAISVLRLLGVGPGGLLPAARAGVAGWLLGLDPQLSPHLVGENAVLLLQSGIEISDEKVRADLVDALLQHAVERGLSTPWELDVTQLDHPGLAGQIAAWLDRDPVTESALWWAAHLAWVGRCRSLAERLAEQAGVRSYAAATRRSLVQVAARLGGPDLLNRLRDLMPVTAQEDPDGDLTGAVIDVLYPGALGPQEILEMLAHDRPWPGMSFRLRASIHDLGRRIPVEDLLAFLSGLTVRSEQGRLGAALVQLYNVVIDTAWQHADRNDVRAALAEALMRPIESSAWLHHLTTDFQRQPPWVGREAERRHALLLDAAAIVEPESRNRIFMLQLVSQTDVPWLLDELPQMAERDVQFFLPFMAPLVDEPTLEIAERILALPPGHPAFEVTRRCRESTDVTPEPDDPWHEISVGNRERAVARAEIVQKMRSEAEATMAGARGDLEQWWKAVALLSYDENAVCPQGHFVHDLTSRPGWTRLASDEQRWFLERGIEYLDGHQPNTDSWASSDRIVAGEVLPDWSGVFLLVTLAKHSPDQLVSISAQTWAKWIPALVAAWRDVDSDDEAARAAIIRDLPADLRAIAAQSGLKHLDRLDAAQLPLSPFEVYRELIPDLASPVGLRLSSGHYESDLAEALLNLLAAEAPATAAEVCLTLINPVKGAAPQLRQRAWHHMARLDPNTAVSLIVDPLQPEGEHADLLANLSIGRLDDRHLADLGAKLLQSHPYGRDPVEQDGIRHATTADAARRLRDAVLHQLSDRGAADEIAALRAATPEGSSAALAQWERDAREHQANRELTILTPSALFTLLRSGDHRLVRHDADLHDVVIDELNRLQWSISHDDAYRDLWDTAANRPKQEDDISDYIRRALNRRFHDGLIIDRENQAARPHQSGVGTRIDLTATVATATTERTLARIIIEAKLLNNQGLMTNMLTQLDQKYLARSGHRHGIYLVYWVKSDQRPDDWSRTRHASRAELETELLGQSTKVSAGLRITPYILDISNPHK